MTEAKSCGCTRVEYCGYHKQFLAYVNHIPQHGSTASYVGYDGDVHTQTNKEVPGFPRVMVTETHIERDGKKKKCMTRISRLVRVGEDGKAIELTPEEEAQEQSDYVRDYILASKRHGLLADLPYSVGGIPCTIGEREKCKAANDQQDWVTRLCNDYPSWNLKGRKDDYAAFRGEFTAAYANGFDRDAALALVAKYSRTQPKRAATPDFDAAEPEEF